MEEEVKRNTSGSQPPISKNQRGEWAGAKADFLLFQALPSTLSHSAHHLNHTIYSCSVWLCLGALPDTLLDYETSSVWWLQTVDGPLWQQQNKSFHTCLCQHVWHLDRKSTCESLNSLRCQPRYQPNITVTLTDVASAPRIQTGSWCQRT